MISFMKKATFLLTLFIVTQYFTTYGKENSVNKRYNILAHKQIITTTYIT